MNKIIKTDVEWQQILSPEVYYVTRQHGTEPPFSGSYVNNHLDGIYECACCQNPLFDSNNKFDSGSGWPSFDQPISRTSIEEERDLSHGMIRTEVLCAMCEAHLGHVFPDGPKTTTLRYCINSICLNFIPRK